MKIKCPKCGNLISSKIGRYWYKESGLTNVYVENIPIYECSGETFMASLFRVGRLNDLIAKAILEKKGLLDPHEIKFLRKNLKQPSSLFAKKLCIGNTTLSKWENGRQRQSPINDRLIRTIYMLYKSTKNVDALNILENTESYEGKDTIADEMIIAEKFQDDYIIKKTQLLDTSTCQIHQIRCSTESSFGPYTEQPIRISQKPKTDSIPSRQFKNISPTAISKMEYIVAN